MSVPSEPPPSAALYAQEIEPKIRALLAGLTADDPVSAKIYRKICQLLRNRLDPEHSRVVLLQAGLNPVRTSELVAILGNEKACHKYLEEGTARNEAVKLARDEDPDSAMKSVGRLLRLLLFHGDQWADGVLQGEWQLKIGSRGRWRFVSVKRRCQIDIFKRVLPL